MEANIKFEQTEISLNTSKEVSASTTNGEPKYFECEICNRNSNKFTILIKYYTKSKLEKHILKCHRRTEFRVYSDGIKEFNKFFKCNYCSEIFNSQKLLNLHHLSHKERLFVKCEFCKTTCENEDKLNEHLKLHEKPKKEEIPQSLIKKFTCNTCRKRYRFERNLKTHLKYCRPEQRLFVECDFCETICDDEDKLIEHLKSHEKTKNDEIDMPLKCNSCGSKFRKEYKLKRHFKLGCPSRCEKCYKSFSNKQKLELHSCSMGDVVYKCNVCNEGFKKKDDLYKHFFIHKFTQGCDLLL